MIYILTGSVHSGKTSNLKIWLNSVRSSAGILCPVINNKRILLCYPVNTSITIESDSYDKSVITCGNYRFLKSAFTEANNYILNLNLSKFNWFFIDEIGKIELSNEGLYDSIKFLLDEQNKFSYNLIFIVRDYLVEEVVSGFKMRGVKIIKDTALIS